MSFQFMHLDGLSTQELKVIGEVLNGSKCDGVQFPWGAIEKSSTSPLFTFGTCSPSIVDTKIYNGSESLFFTTIKDHDTLEKSEMCKSSENVSSDSNRDSIQITSLNNFDSVDKYDTTKCNNTDLDSKDYFVDNATEQLLDTSSIDEKSNYSKSNSNGSHSEPLPPNKNGNANLSNGDVKASDIPVNTSENGKMPVANSSAWSKSTNGSKLFTDILKSKHTRTNNLPVIDHKKTSAQKDNNIKQLSSILSSVMVKKYEPIPVVPRGLVNKGNWCYINATLQALLHCSPFYTLMMSLSKYAEPSVERGCSSTPLTDCLVRFMKEFDVDKSLSCQGSDLVFAQSFEPSYIYNVLHVMDSDGGSSFKLGHQEDAEEFFSSLLNAVHDEMVEVLKKAKKMKIGNNKGNIVMTNGHPAIENEDIDDGRGWEQVSSKRKTVITRTASIESSPISSLFGGQIRYNLQRRGLKESANLQPFFTLQLEVQSPRITSVSDALQQFITKERIPGYTCGKTKTQIEASRFQTLETLPPILTLHLKCFVYDHSGGCQKIIKQIDFDTELELNRELLSPSVKHKYAAQQRKYMLFAVVNHHGARVLGGHYTTHFLHSSSKQWLRADDHNITPCSIQQVTQFLHNRMPYLLFYKRADLLKT